MAKVNGSFTARIGEFIVNLDFSQLEAPLFLGNVTDMPPQA